MRHSVRKVGAKSRQEFWGCRRNSDSVK